MKTFKLALLLFSSTAGMFSQKVNTINGFVRDESTGERLGGVIVCVSGSNAQSTSNDYGYYSLLVVQSDSIELSARMVGYRHLRVKLRPTSDTLLNIALFPMPIQTGEVVVEGNRDAQINLGSFGRTRFAVDRNTPVPAPGGEVDLIKLIQQAAGVQGGNEFSNGLYVRGGSFDQNLILLDDVPVYNINHLFGYFSIFQPEAIKTAELLKGDVPAKYGGRLSSVLNILLREGNKEQLHVVGGISFVTARAMVEGPLFREQDGSFLLAARRTYVDPLLSLVTSSTSGSDISNFSFYDLTLKANATLSASHRLYLSGYFGGDDFVIKDPPNELEQVWGNYAFALRLNSLWKGNFFTNITLAYSEYRNKYRERSYLDNADKEPGVSDIMAKIDLDIGLFSRSHLTTGLSITHHAFRVFASFRDPENSRPVFLESYEGSGYVSMETQVSDEIKAIAGLRLGGFSSGEHLVGEPRLTFLAQFSSETSWKLSYNHHHQFIHSLSSFSLMSPGEFYYPSTNYLKPERSKQITIGVQTVCHNVFMVDEIFQISCEAYYKDMQSLPQLKHTLSSVIPEDIPNSVGIGKGWGYGLELGINRKQGNMDVWLQYTFAKVRRLFEDINNGNPFPPTHGREHSLNITGEYRGWESWSVGFTFVIASGQPTTLPVGRFSLNGNTQNGSYADVIDYGMLNTQRLPMYNRLDIGASYAFTWLQGEWTLQMSLYNIYGYPNPLFNNFDVRSKEFQQTSVGFLPSLGLNYSF